MSRGRISPPTTLRGWRNAFVGSLIHPFYLLGCHFFRTRKLSIKSERYLGQSECKYSLPRNGHLSRLTSINVFGYLHNSSHKPAHCLHHCRGLFRGVLRPGAVMFSGNQAWHPSTSHHLPALHSKDAPILVSASVPIPSICTSIGTRSNGRMPNPIPVASDQAFKLSRGPGSLTGDWCF